MTRFIVKRLLQLIPLLLAINFVIFTIMYFSPGDPARLILGSNSTLEARQAWLKENGLDRPFLLQYWDNLKNLVTLDFGRSYVSGRYVADEIAARLPVTAIIAVGSIVVGALLIGIPFGILSAVKQYSFIDYASTFVALFFSSFPVFAFSLILMLLFCVKFPVFPIAGVNDTSGFVLPIIVAGTLNSADILRLTRSSMLEVVRQDYVRTIRSKGAPEHYIIFHHELKNALLPVITAVGFSFGYALGGVVVIETIFSLPGIGAMLVSSVRSLDRPMVTITVTLLASAFCLINLLVDVIYAACDPRLRNQY